MQGPARRRSDPGVVVAVVLALAVGGCGDAPPSGSAASAGASPASASPATAPSVAPLASQPAASAAPPVGTPLPPPSHTPLEEDAFVPVTNFRSPVDRLTRAQLASVVDGSSSRWKRLELVESEAQAILAALGIDRTELGGRLVTTADAGRLAKDLAKHRDRLGFVRADAVGPSVRALAWGDRSLFGVDRLSSLADWPLVAPLPGDASAATADPAGMWTLVAGGDILLDRGVARTVKVLKRGVDFPFDGGTAEITGRYCCSSFGWELPRTRRTGNRGAVRALIERADIAIANFENPAPDRYRYHTSGTVFSADPKLIAGLANAGIDYVSLANNHIRDAGATGVLQTIENLGDHGIAHSGAGRDIAAARRPAMLEAKGVSVAILAYDAIARYYFAGTDRVGSAGLSAKAVKADVAAARKKGADVVIVFPHWGVEYRARPFAAQQRLARQIVDAGADMVIGNHAHWAGAMEVYKGRPIWYALGNFVFDQVWSEPTMEGLTLELTFRGTELLQARMRPHIILDRAQPNFLDPAGDGRVVLSQVFGASKGILPW